MSKKEKWGLVVMGAVVGFLFCLMIWLYPGPPTKLGLTANPGTVAPGEIVSITVMLLDENGNLVEAKNPVPVDLKFSFKEGGSITDHSIVIPSGKSSAEVRYGFIQPAGNITVEARSKGLTSNTTEIEMVV